MISRKNTNEEATLGYYNNSIPEKIMTPDKVETRVGIYERTCWVIRDYFGLAGTRSQLVG